MNLFGFVAVATFLFMSANKCVATDQLNFSEDVCLNEEKFKKFNHHPAFKTGEILTLINRGQDIISLLINNNIEDIDKIYSNIEKQDLVLFKDKGYKFSDKKISFLGYSIDYSHVPTASSVGRTLYLKQPKDPVRTLNRQKRLEAVVSVIWALAYAPCVNSEGFVRGSFSIKDDNFKLCEFLCKYAVFAEKVNNIDEIRFPHNAYGFAYSRDPNYKVEKLPKLRLSSHYQDQTRFQCGIDTLFEGTGYPLPVLPFGNTHILFGRVTTPSGKEKTFIKLEPIGLGTILDAIAHGVKWAEHEGDPRTMRREKDILIPIHTHLRAIINGLMGWDEQTAKICGRFEYNKTDTWKSSYMSISEMKYALKYYRDSNKEGLKLTQEKEDEFFETLKKHRYSLDDLDYRTGNEVILSLEDIANPKSSSNYVKTQNNTNTEKK